MTDVQQELELTRRLLDIARRVPDIAQVYRAFALELEKFASAYWAALVLIEHDETRVYPMKRPEEGRKATSPLAETTLSRILTSKQAKVETDVPASTYQWLGCPPEAKSIVWLPLLAGNEAFGALAIVRFTDDAHGEKLLPLLECFAGLLALAVRIWRLQEDKEAAKRQNAERAYLMDVAVHELKTALTAIIASAGLLREELNGKIGESQVRLIRNLSDSVEHLESTTSELSDLVRARTGAFVLHTELCTIGPTLKGAVARVTTLARSRSQTLALQLPNSLPKVLVDRRRLEQVMLHLLSNAIKFTPEGGRITVRTSFHDSDIIVEVQDSAPIIPEVERQKIFKPYYRIEADRQQMPGMGLGIAVSKQLVEAHGGKIWLSSEVGRGNTFAFSLPCANTCLPNKSVSIGKDYSGGIK